MAANASVARQVRHRFLRGGGGMGALMRAHDWATTPLGDPAGWPLVLKTAVQALLASPDPTVFWWGPHRIQFHNDAYCQAVGPERHPGDLAHAEEPARRRREQEHAQFARLFEQAPAFMAVLRGPQHRFQLANPEYMRVIGHREVLGRTVAEALPEAVGQGYVALLDRVFATGHAFTAHGSRIESQESPGGPVRERYLDFVYQPIRGADGHITGIFVVGVDVTDRTVSEAALRESEAKLRALNADLERQVAERAHERGMFWQLTSDLLGVLNGQGYFEKTNPAWHTLLGWTEEEIRTTSLFDLLHPDDLEATRSGFVRLVGGEPALNFVNRYRCKDGSYRWLSWVGVPEEGKYYCSGRDITAEKEGQLALNAAQEALRQSQKMEAVGQLTGGIAHDFNNLLGSIGASLQVLETRVARGRLENIERYTGMAQDAVRRAAALTQRLLAFSRRQTLDPKPTDVNRLVASMEDLVRRTVGPSVALMVDAAADLWLTRIDPPQLESALLNLCINARDAMLPACGRLTITTANHRLDEQAARENELPPGEYVLLSIADTGTGMNADTMARAFDPFFTTKPLGQGTGLGLSMVYGFVRQSGGQVRIHSRTGHGTTMCLYLPRYIGEMDEDPSFGIHETVLPGGGETVLVIEDETTIRLLVAEVLQEAGYTVLQAADGPAGLQLLQSDARIDLLLTDVGLPGGINGRQVADAARVRRSGLRVLFITGYAENAAVGDGQLEPGMEVITKPFDIAALANRVRSMLER